MQVSNSFKKVFLKKLLVGLQHDDFSSKNMSLTERKNAIKLSSDVALAFAGNGAIWSQALITDVSKQEKNKTLMRHILGNEFERMTEKPCGRSVACKMVRSKKILKRSYIQRRIRKSAPRRMIASAIAKRIVKKRTQVLKCIIPGGESMDEFSLLDETIDYILSLRAQVDVMRRLANVFELSNLK
ncbi:transcription factor IBH1-like 1 [Magnolia sinica]|uniref:transcription factor IBH1-like 1 n=1 Tax=Magnolia sinica TaxID=86752 RepID=UPI0026596B2E|nr:transcription factor IBH1-like 1 [Magnolia sinica]